MCAIVVRRWSWVALTLLLTGAMVMADTVVVKPDKTKPDTVTYTGKVTKIAGGKLTFEPKGLGAVTVKLVDIVSLTSSEVKSVFVPRCGKAVGNQGFPESGVVSLDRITADNQRLTVDGKEYLFVDDTWLRQLRVGVDDWTKEVALSYAGKFGDTANTVAEGKATFSRDVYRKRDTVVLKAKYDDSNSDGKGMQRSYEVDAKTARDRRDGRFYTYWLLNLNRDYRQGYALRTTGSYGLGHRWVGEQETLDIFAGPQFVNTDYREDAVDEELNPKVDTSQWAGLLGMDWSRKLESFELSDKARWQGIGAPDSQLLTNEVTVAYKLGDGWKLTLGHELTYNPRPTDDNHEVNQTVKVGVALELK